jgi:hypothetical protein
MIPPVILRRLTWHAAVPLACPAAVVLQLTSAGLSLTAEARSLLAAADLPGPISHIVVNSVSPEHWIALPQWLGWFPDATVWVTQGAANEGCPQLGLASFFGLLRRCLKGLFRRQLWHVDGDYMQAKTNLNGVNVSVISQSYGSTFALYAFLPTQEIADSMTGHVTLFAHAQRMSCSMSTPHAMLCS